jgi:hypothetical protein
MYIYLTLQPLVIAFKIDLIFAIYKLMANFENWNTKNQTSSPIFAELKFKPTISRIRNSEE